MIPILYQHPDFILIDKPIGVAVQNEAHDLGLLPGLCRQIAVDKLWLVHRLDKATSGVMLLAKHAQAASELSQGFAQRQVSKYYLALSANKPKKKQGKIIGDMHKIRDGKWALRQSTENPAVSQFFSFSVSPGIRAFILKPHTGKTHQLRVAMKSLGAPILGDELYGGTKSDRCYLHAYQLAFSYQGNDYCIDCSPTVGSYFNNEQWQQCSLPEPQTLNWPTIKIPAGER